MFLKLKKIRFFSLLLFFSFFVFSVGDKGLAIDKLKNQLGDSYQQTVQSNLDKPLFSEAKKSIGNDFNKTVQENQKKTDQVIRDGKYDEMNVSKKQKENSQDVQETSQADNFGVDLNSDCMLGGTCTFSIYDATKVKKNRVQGERTSVMVFIQDIVLGATIFIGVIVTVALILSGLLYVFSTVDSALANKAKTGIKYSLIGMFLVMLSLVIIRLIQFLARGGS